MTPAARHQAAIEILDRWLAGVAAEKALVQWSRGARYAGSKDRAAVRDIVFDAVRRRRSAAWRGGQETGRGLVIGLLIERDADPAAIFTGERFAPELLTRAEIAHRPAPMPDAVAHDLPDWLWDRFRVQLGDRASAVAMALRERAPVHLRANLLKTTREAVAKALAAEGIVTAAVPRAATALHVVEGARRVAQSRAFAEGLVELQDASSQASVLAAAPAPGSRILDYCAGGGGKALALCAARGEGPAIVAHDIEARRMRDLPARAARAGAAIDIIAPESAPAAAFDLVYVDAPCSGSGTWRRSPEAKWTLTEAGLARYATLQREILSKAAAACRPGGRIVFATCSILAEENEEAMAHAERSMPFLSRTDRLDWLPSGDGDGFFTVIYKNNRQ